MPQQQSQNTPSAVPFPQGGAAALLGPLARPLHGGYDELRDPTGTIRPHWHEFSREVGQLSNETFGQRWREAQQLIRENGVTYNVFDEPKASLRPWRLDPLPVLLSQREFEALSAGLIQRARLVEAILADLYGEQRLLHEGHIPPEFVYDNPGYLRPLRGVAPPGGTYLHLYAANLGRDDAGDWQVLRDRMQAPSGAGYLLENRIVVSRMLPEAFQKCRVQRLASFFQTFLNGLRSSAYRNRDNPRIVLLSDGPKGEAYFEQAYLARYLGLSLVEGGDLTVRDKQVSLKVLGGLQPVDVVLRRLDDLLCDPLELQPEAFRGVPGLLQAIRAKTVAVVNGLGTAVVEAPAFFALLPELCRTLLGEELLLPSAATSWCGHAQQLRRVLANPRDFVLKSAFATRAISTAILEECSEAERQQHLAALRAAPGRYVAQRRMSLSTVPVFRESHTEDRRFILRAFLAADQGGFTVLPGGLACFGSTVSSRSMSMSHGGGSKDTWVLSDTPVSTFSRLPHSNSAVELTRAGGDLPSRAADNLFWLGRYAERAEAAARLLRSALARLTDQNAPGDHSEVPALLCAVVVQSKTPLAPEHHRGGNLQADVYPLVFAAGRPYSLASVVGEWHRVASYLRDRISVDMWRVVSAVQRGVEDTTKPRTAGEVLEVLDRTVLNLAAFGGLATESMSRGEGWRFLDLGRKLERSLGLLTLVSTALGSPVQPESFMLDAVLEVADARMTYRRRYLSQLQLEPVLDLILLDETNPRSLLSLLLDCQADVQALPRKQDSARLAIEQVLILKAVTAMQLTEIDTLARSIDGSRSNLVVQLDDIAEHLRALSKVLTDHYLTHLKKARNLMAPEGPA